MYVVYLNKLHKHALDKHLIFMMSNQEEEKRDAKQGARCDLNS